MYIETISKLDIKWPTKYDDMFPLRSGVNEAFWTGYFTSRPTSKDNIRRVASLYHSSGKFFAVEALKSGIDKSNITSMIKA